MLSLSTSQLASIASAVAIEGEREGVIKAIAALSEAGPDDLSFLGNAKYTAEVAHSKAGVILVPR
ncbi:MAG: UDP-3-O-(3-hydroxymyristoyl)glucosamine N-acyltransferase, partial [Verrucomicrobia bacterium]|nr:UDP-3-O-(3-hydroxymyristoyl)glucosamine N-acyltransferase [Verrucomicrobiota bacterium]